MREAKLRNKRINMGAMALAGILALTMSATARAQAPQSDDFSGTTQKAFWTFENIGDTGGIGDIKYQNGSAVINAGGADVWGTADAMSFLYQKVSGDFMATVKVVEGLGDPADTFSKAGIMLRSANTEGASYAYLFESPRRSGVLWEARRADDISSDFGEAPTNDQPPIWLRLTRIGGVITPYTSKDGVHFTQSGSALDANITDTDTEKKSIPGLAKDPILVGIAQTAHTTDETKLPATATYDDFSAVAFSAVGTVSGTVTTSDKKGTGGTVNFTSADGSLSFAAVADATTGAYSIKIPAGTYTVTGGDAVGSVYSGLPSAPITVTGGSTTTVPAIINDLPPFFESATPSPFDDDFTGATLDKKWTNKDIGDSEGGGAVPKNGKLEVSAGGHDIWDVVDGFNFTYQKVSGDFAATLRVEAIPDNQDWELAGLMLRTDDSDNSAYALNQISPRHQIQNKLRPTKGAASTNVDLDAATTMGNDILPAWLKLRRVGNKLAYYWTKDPATGPILGSVRDVPDFGNKDLLVGIAATSHAAGITDPGFVFSNFRVVPLTTGPTGCANTLGDLNGDSKINVQDATLSLQIAVGSRTATDAQKCAGDVNKDGKWNVQDTTLILRRGIGAITKFPGE